MSDLALTGAVLPALPHDEPDPLMQMTAAWLIAQKSPNTRAAYRRDVTGIGTTGEPARTQTPAWLPWCDLYDLQPLQARRMHVDAFRLALEAAGCSPRTVARKLAAVSSWYDYLLDEELTERNPAKKAARPEIDKDTSPAVGLTAKEGRAFLASAEADGPLADATLKLLALNGVRVSVILNARPRDFGYDSGHRIIRFTLKGGKPHKAPIVPQVDEAIENYKKTSRGTLSRDDLLFLKPNGDPLDESFMRRLVQRIARTAGIPSWRDLSPHSLRHTFATVLLGMGVPLAVVQDIMGHLDPRTTQAYNHARDRLDGHPTYKLAGVLLPSPESLRDEPLPHPERSET